MLDLKNINMNTKSQKYIWKKIAYMVQHIHRRRPSFYIQATPYDVDPWCSCVRHGGGLIEPCQTLVCLLCMVRGVTPHLVLLPQLGRGHTVRLSHCHMLTLSHWDTGTLSSYNTVTMSHCHDATLWHCHLVILSVCYTGILSCVKLSYIDTVTM